MDILRLYLVSGKAIRSAAVDMGRDQTNSDILCTGLMLYCRQQLDEVS